MKIEWRGLKRIQCYLQVIDDKPVKDAKGKTIPNNKVLDSCIKMRRPSTKHLNINYGKIPKKPKCPKDNVSLHDLLCCQLIQGWSKTKMCKELAPKVQVP